MTFTYIINKINEHKIIKEKILLKIKKYQLLICRFNA